MFIWSGSLILMLPMLGCILTFSDDTIENILLSDCFHPFHKNNLTSFPISGRILAGAVSMEHIYRGRKDKTDQIRHVKIRSEGGEKTKHSAF